jgi:hypothetical protein
MGSERGHGDIGVSGSCLNLFKDRVGEKGDTASLLQQRTAISIKFSYSNSLTLIFFIAGLPLVSVSSAALQATDIDHFLEKIIDELITTARVWIHRTLNILLGLLGCKLDFC